MMKTKATVELKCLKTYHCEKSYNLGFQAMGTIDSNNGFRASAANLV